jgi:diaminohydroxyphosphoribosylaminopyrimidine deaminase/5-amino-6-(5-phosphoribosylamino)uracil reductase
MRRLIRLALEKKGTTGSNPPTAAAVVKNGEVLAIGVHEGEGKPHAEVLALQKAGKNAKGAELYVTLEPCTHQGKTPPCVTSIYEAGIKRVVYASDDPNPIVRQQPAPPILAAYGLDVVSGVLREEADKLIEIFKKNITKHLPFVLMKAGMSLDGKIALSNKESKYITNARALQKAHQLRKECGAVMVGPGTVRADNPFLNLRYRFENYSAPKRIIIDLKASLQLHYNVFLPSAEVVWVVSQTAKVPPGLPSHITVFRHADIKGCLNWSQLLTDLFKAGIRGVMLEGGQTLFTSALQAGVIDRVDVVLAPKLLGGKAMSLLGDWEVGSLSDAIQLARITSRRFGDNIWLSGYLDS